MQRALLVVTNLGAHPEATLLSENLRAGRNPSPHRGVRVGPKAHAPTAKRAPSNTPNYSLTKPIANTALPRVSSIAKTALYRR